MSSELRRPARAHRPRSRQLMRGAAWVASVAALGLAAPVAAQTPNPGAAESDPEGASREAFERARAAAAQNQWAEACPLFQRAHDLNATNGTAFQLARCYDTVGAVASARTYYQYVVDHADRDSVPERVERARTRLAELHVPAATPPPRPSSTAPAPELPRPSSPPPRSADREAGSITPAIVAFGIGGAGAAVGTIFSVLAFSQASDVKDECGADRTCPPKEEANADAAVTKGWVGAVGLGVGVAGILTGAALLLTRSTPARVGSDGRTIRIRF